MGVTVQDQPPLPGLRAALVDAAGSYRTRLRVHHTRMLAAAAVVILFAVTAGFFLAPTRIEAGVLVERVGDEWVVRISDAAVRPDAVVLALGRRGVRAQVTPVAVGPSRIGEFVAVGGPVTLDGDDRLSSAVARIPVRATVVRLRLGRTAERGEAYDVPSDAYAEGEPLECSGVWGRRIGDVLEGIRRRFGGTIEWMTPDGTTAANPDPTHVVTHAVVRAPDRLLVAVSPHVATSFAMGASSGSPACPLGGTA